MLCPVCRYEHQHVTATWQNIPGEDHYEAGWGGRGDLLVVPMWCEHEHTWEICLGSHKGETFSFVRAKLEPARSRRRRRGKEAA